jgi:hypothetical protein
MIYLLNAPILTDYGKYIFEKIPAAMATAILTSSFETRFTSAVGHQGTADMLTSLLGVPVPMNRIAIRMEPGDTAIVFRLKNRLQEGVILSEEELAKLVIEFGVLERI